MTYTEAEWQQISKNVPNKNGPEAYVWGSVEGVEKALVGTNQTLKEWLQVFQANAMSHGFVVTVEPAAKHELVPTGRSYQILAIRRIFPQEAA